MLEGGAVGGSSESPFLVSNQSGSHTKKNKIITIQYERLSTLNGRPEGELAILTEWKSHSERAMLENFRKVFSRATALIYSGWGESLRF
jgi:hypothetical protein